MATVPDQANVHQLIGHLFRYEAGRMAAVLTRLLGAENIDTAEDLVQDTLLKAMETWRFRGVPDNPAAWLYKVARNKAIDWVRHHQSQTRMRTEYLEHFKENAHDVFAEEEIQDSVLRMMFACCHPAIPRESQIALTLKTLAGLSAIEIADAFLASEETIAKRIYRAKEKFKQENIRLDPPGVFELPHRLDSVLHVLYLMFNEGYYSSHDDVLIREDLCAEAMRLAYLLAQHHATRLPKVDALLALMCLQSSRFAARTGTLGEIVLLEHQDRRQWSQPLIERGLGFLERASEGSWLSEYHIEASIASIHSLAPSFQETNWEKLVELYRTLHERNPSPMVSLNKAIAIGYAQSSEEGVRELQKINGLEQNVLYLTALGNFYFLQRNMPEAKKYFEFALQKKTSQREADLIQSKIQKCLSASAKKPEPKSH